MYKQKVFRTYPLCGPKGNLFFYFYNPLAYLYRFFSPRKEKEPLSANPRVLLCCEAELGDVVLASSVIPSLKQKFPGCHIGFLCKKEALLLLKNIKGIDAVHFRGKGLIKEIRGYDISLELHPFFPSSIPLTKKAGIRTRIGFDSAGYDVWLTDPATFPQPDYLPRLYGGLLSQLGISSPSLKPALFFQPPSRVFPKEYIILHLGTTNPLKEWEVHKWKELARLLKEKGFPLLFTGKGLREKRLIQEAFKGLGEDLCDALSWNDFMAAISGAKAVITVDSVPLHLAAAFNVPLVGLYLYNHVVELWLPDAEKVRLLVNQRCLRKTKADHPKATYLKEVNVSDVLEHLDQLL